MTDVHKYDGQLVESKKNIDVVIEIVAKYSKEERDNILEQALVFFITALNELNDKDINKYKNAIVNMLSMIINDHKLHGRQRPSPNYDSKDDLFACDLLIICYRRLYDYKICTTTNDNSGSSSNNNDKVETLIYKTFFEQIIDTLTGGCPEGRVKRLFQFLLA